MRRATSYDAQLSQRLRKPSYAREFILGLMEGPDELTAEDALRHTLQRIFILHPSAFILRHMIVIGSTSSDTFFIPARALNRFS
jgi:hypothetical protein